MANNPENTVFREINMMLTLTTMFHFGHLSIAAARVSIPKEEMQDYIELVSAMQLAMLQGLNATEEEVQKAMKKAKDLNTDVFDMARLLEDNDDFTDGPMGLS